MMLARCAGPTRASTGSDFVSGEISASRSRLAADTPLTASSARAIWSVHQTVLTDAAGANLDFDKGNARAFTAC